MTNSSSPDNLPTASTPNGHADAMPPPHAPRNSAASGERAGDFIGPYKLMEIIGEGGFGTVWLGERREPMVQRVALKIIKPGMDSKAVIARFEQERQALAVMDHPNVAKVFDGGVTPAGRPYFAMEHVKGEPITTFADRQRLTITQRLKLFIPVCEAVQHAHMKGIIHRDLKPSNILVANVGDESSTDAAATRGMLVKVIDFGVAKAISHTLTDKTIFTEQGQIIGTPEYMSPEQAEMGATDIDTRTDVYSLGVVLYELLCGSVPFESNSLRSAGYAEIQRIIREVDPPKPSTRLGTADDATGAAIAKARQQDRERIAGELRRELEWIPLKALRKDRSQRYDSPSDLARDLRRYLDSEPLDAGPESMHYRVGKLLRRHKRSSLAVVSIVGAVSIGLAGTLWQAKQARADRNRAWDALATSNIAVALSQQVSSETMRDLDSVVRLRGLLRQPLHGEAVLATWLTAEIQRENGQYSQSASRFKDAIAKLNEAVASVGAESLLRQVNSVLPALCDAETAEDLRCQMERGWAVALGGTGQWLQAAEVLRTQRDRLRSGGEGIYLQLHAQQDLAVVLAAAGRHGDAVAEWDEFEAQYRKVGQGQDGATGMFRTYSKCVYFHSHDFLDRELDLWDSMIETGANKRAEQGIVAAESAWRQSFYDPIPAAEEALIQAKFKELREIVQGRRGGTPLKWQNPLELLVKLYGHTGRPELQKLWESRLESIRDTGKPPRRWPTVGT